MLKAIRKKTLAYLAGGNKAYESRIVTAGAEKSTALNNTSYEKAANTKIW